MKIPSETMVLLYLCLPSQAQMSLWAFVIQNPCNHFNQVDITQLLIIILYTLKRCLQKLFVNANGSSLGSAKIL